MATLSARRQFQDVFSNVITYSGTLDVASLADGAGATQVVTVAEAAVGDLVFVSMNTDLLDVTVTAYVQAANTVEVRFQNESAGVRDLPSATLYLTVLQRNPQVYI